MNNKDGSIQSKVILVDVIILFLIVFGYLIFYNYIYSNLSLKLDNTKNIVYGSKKYDIRDFIVSSNGEVVDIIDNVDTSIVGEQKVDVILEKCFISKIVPITVNVIDISAPVIKLKNTEITITEGETYNLLENITSVNDDVDGEITYQLKELVNEEIDSNYYTINTSFNSEQEAVAGEYEVEVKAVDKSNNISTSIFTINVEEVKVEEPLISFREVTYASAGANSNANGIVNTAMSLIGSPYVYGGTTPQGFDCSGFVQYVYAQNGLGISRSSSTQAYDGVGINYYDAQPGDILIWGYSNGTITHSALYIGNDLMIHAANPSAGVIQSSVSGWTRGSDVQVLYVRRVVS